MRSYKTQIFSAAAIVALYVVLEMVQRMGLMNPYWARILSLSFIMTISAVGLSLIYGFAGQFSLGHAAFYGVGAYTAAYVSKTVGVQSPELWFPVALIAGAVVAGLVGYLIGLPILRLRSDYLGIATLGFGVIVKVFMDNSNRFDPIFGGARGMMGIPRLTTFAWVFWLMVLTVLLARNLVNSSHGRAIISVREDEVAAGIMGINTTRYKLLAFSLGCALAGLAGGLFAHQYAFLSPRSFDFLRSVDVLLIVVMGGLGSLTGTVVTAIGWVFLMEWLNVILPQGFEEWRGVIYAVALVVLMLSRPRGLLSGKEFSLDRFIGASRAVKKGGSDNAPA